MTFKNGYTISVQWGECTYSDNYNRIFPTIAGAAAYEKLQFDCDSNGSCTAEIAIISPKTRDLIEFKENRDTVKGYCTANEVLKWMNYAASIKEEGE